MSIKFRFVVKHLKTGKETILDQGQVESMNEISEIEERDWRIFKYSFTPTQDRQYMINCDKHICDLDRGQSVVTRYGWPDAKHRAERFWFPIQEIIFEYEKI